MIQKSYEKNVGCCYIIPTPIGNMSDITERAIYTLCDVDAVFAEDTRVTGQLLSSLNISKKIYQCQKFNENKASILALNLLKDNKNIAIVTDRGTPLISDPGSLVVKKIIDAGFNVIALPGACAFIPALNMSGLDQDKFLFYGFLDSKESQSLKELEMLKNINFTIVLYESPHRLYKTLQNMLKILGNRRISISREISKMHEEVFRGNIEEALEVYESVKGEIVIVIEKNNEDINYDDVFSNVLELIQLGVSPKEAIKYISSKYNVSRNNLYKMYEESK